MLEGPQRRRGAAANAGLLVDVLNVVSDRFDGDAEIVGDLLVGLAAHEHEKDLQFALGQTGRQLAGSLRYPVARAGEHSVDSLWIEPSLFDLRTWGWITLFWGIVVGLAGLGLLSGGGWARWFTIVVGSLNFIVQLGFVGSAQYPLWALTVLALTVVVLYGLIVHWDDARELA